MKLPGLDLGMIVVYFVITAGVVAIGRFDDWWSLAGGSVLLGMGLAAFDTIVRRRGGPGD